MSDSVCSHCLDDVREGVRCEGRCGRSFHRECWTSQNNNATGRICHLCRFPQDSSRSVPVAQMQCFACKTWRPVEDTFLCGFPQCGRRFCQKKLCLERDPLTLLADSSVYRCPAHSCRQCGVPQRDGDRDGWNHCVFCSKSYHSKCLPMDVQRITKRHFQCMEHVSESAGTASFSMGCHPSPEETISQSEGAAAGSSPSETGEDAKFLPTIPMSTFLSVHLSPEEEPHLEEVEDLEGAMQQGGEGSEGSDEKELFRLEEEEIEHRRREQREIEELQRKVASTRLEIPEELYMGRSVAQTRLGLSNWVERLLNQQLEKNQSILELIKKKKFHLIN